MPTEVIFYTQVTSIIGFITALFVLYRVLVRQKDAVIQLLKERIAEKDEHIAKLKDQSPDTLAAALSDRIKISLEEITRLRSDGATHEKQIESKENELAEIQAKLGSLSELIRESDLVCPKCGDPQAGRQLQTIYGGRDGEQEADIVINNYKCGYSIADDGKELSRCEHQLTT